MVITRNVVIVVVVLAAGIVLAAAHTFPRYSMVAAGSNAAFRLDRRTGDVSVVSLRRDPRTRVMSATVSDAVNVDDSESALADARREPADGGGTLRILGR